MQKELQRIDITTARNNLFSLMQESYLQKKSFLIEKRNIPLVYVIPVSTDEFDFDNQTTTLQQARALRKSMKKTSNSVSLLRKMRQYGS